MDSDSDGEFSLDSFCIVRRRCAETEGGDGDAVAVPTPIMAALSAEPHSSPTPMSGDAQMSQPPSGTSKQGIAAVAAPMAALQSRSPEPSPARSPESGARRRRQPTRWCLKPRNTVESIFSNFKKRRGALIRALTEDKEAFFQKCDPGMQHLHLYAGTDGSWEVKPPSLKLPAPEPEPTPGINICRDTMEQNEWLQKVAVHCDAWLMRISAFAASYMTATERGRLFAMIIDLPMVQETLPKRSSGSEANAVAEKQEAGSSGPDDANEVVEEQGLCLIEEQRSNGPTEAAYEALEEMEEYATEDDNNTCASCYSHYKANAFWISCDTCNKWYHGKCVKMTSREAEHIKHYECPDCRDDRVGHDGK